MTTATFSQPWVSTTVSMTNPRGGNTYVVASSAEVDAHVQSLLQEQAQKAGAEPDSSLGSYVTSVLRETDGQLPVTELAEYESLRELIQEQCWLDSFDQLPNCQCFSNQGDRCTSGKLRQWTFLNCLNKKEPFVLVVFPICLCSQFDFSRANPQFWDQCPFHLHSKNVFKCATVTKSVPNSQVHF